MSRKKKKAIWRAVVRAGEGGERGRSGPRRQKLIYNPSYPLTARESEGGCS